jgi:hypothetical protein
VVPAEERAQYRRQVADQRAVGVDAPVELDVRAAAAPLEARERPDPDAGEVADDLRLDPMRPVDRDDLRGRLQGV